jgi:hypothetical protein
MAVAFGGTGYPCRLIGNWRFWIERPRLGSKLKWEGIEPMTSAVTGPRKPVTYRKEANGWLPFGALRHEW